MTKTTNTGQKVFFLGMGMAKAGTTWLFKFLESHPLARMGREKEIHVLHAPEYGSYPRALLHVPWKKFNGRSWLKTQLVRAWYRARWTRYFDYFASLLDNGARLTGDLSPSNQFMSVESLARVRREFESRGIRVVPVLIVRDPVDRLFSEVRHAQKVRDQSRYRRRIPRTESELVLEKLREASERSRMDAPDTVSRLLEVFAEEEIVVLLHEDLFQQHTMDRLMRQAGMPPIPADTGSRINATPVESDLEEQVRGSAIDAFLPTYRWAAGHFGVERILSAWPNARIALSEQRKNRAQP
jgi:hypothetical protein